MRSSGVFYSFNSPLYTLFSGNEKIDCPSDAEQSTILSIVHYALCIIDDV